MLHRQRRGVVADSAARRKSTSSKRRASTCDRGCSISEACPLILPYHVALDQAREAAKGAGKIGTTGRGIGPAYEDKVARRAIRLQDLFAPERFAAKLGEVLDYHNFVLKHYLKAKPVDFQKTLDETLALRRALQPLVADVPRALYRRAARRQEPAVRRRAGHAARRRPWHLSVRDVEQLRRGCGVRPAPASGRRCCITCWALPRPIRRASARDRFRPNSTTTSASNLRRARQRIRIGHRPAAALRLVRCGGAQALDPDQWRLRACA